MIIMNTMLGKKEFVGNREDLFIVETIIIVLKLAAFQRGMGSLMVEHESCGSIFEESRLKSAEG